ncbi:TPA: YadA-like family protein [Serratia fonticola]|nr:YadA-like family protein [Serratia fonticola]
MNKIYRLVWNASQRAWVVAGEFAAAKGKGASTLRVAKRAGTMTGAVVATLLSLPAEAWVAGTGTSSAALDGNIATNTSINGGNATGSGGNNIAIGSAATASGTSQSIAIGNNATASGPSAIAIGKEAQGLADYAIAIGREAQAAAKSSIAFGHKTNAMGVGDVAIGTNAIADGRGGVALAFGANVNAIGANTTVIGNDVSAKSGGSIAIMGGTTADFSSFDAVDENSNFAIVMGSGSRAQTAANGIAIGLKTTAGANNAIAFGNLANASGDSAIATGKQAKASGAYSIAQGANAVAGASTAIAIGYNAQANDFDSVALGSYAVANKSNSFVLGNQAQSDSAATILIAANYDVPDNIAEVLIDDSSTGAILLGSKSHITNSDHSLALGTWINATDATSGIAIGTGSSIKGDHSVAIGHNASSLAADAISMGEKANASAASSMALGKLAKASGLNSIAQGNNALASGNESVAVAANASATGARALAMGSNATAGYNDGVALGTEASAAGANSVAIGKQAGKGAASDMTFSTFIGTQAGYNATGGLHNTAIGDYSFSGSGGTSSLAMGSYALSNSQGIANMGLGYASAMGVQGNNNIGIGRGSIEAESGAGSHVTGNSNIGMGYSAGINVNGNDNLALGSRAGQSITANRSVSLGVEAQASADDAIANGTSALASGVEAIALGHGAQATGLQSISVGTGNIVSGDHSGAFGDPSIITGSGSYSLGNNNRIDANKAFVVGNNVAVDAGLDGAVVLGDGSTVGAAVATSGVTISDTDYLFAGVTPSSTVSVGALGAERTITNVAAGRLSETSTDAINGSQLFATNTAVDGLNDRTLKYDWTDTNGDGKVDPSEVHYDKATLAGVTSTDGGRTNGTKITNLARGDVTENSTDAINGSQLFDLTGDTSNTYTDTNGLGIRYARTNEAGLPQADAYAEGQASTAVGYQARATEAGSIAMGKNAQSSVVNAVAIGLGAVADVARSVALGDGAKTAAAVGTTGTTINDTDYAFAGTAPVGTVSVGSVGNERTITNVAAGRLSETSTDAINGSQLFATNTAVDGLNDRTLKYNWTDTNGDGKVDPSEVDYGKATLAGDTYDNVTHTGGTTIANVADGVALSDAVNVSQLKKSTEAVKTHYYSVNDGSVEQANYENDGATGVNALAVGIAALGSGENSIAMGIDSVSAGLSSMALGQKALTNGQSALAIGTNALATAQNALAIGKGAQASGQNSLSIGTGNIVSGDNSGAIGDPSIITGSGSYSLGNNNTINSNNAFAVGNNVTLAAGTNEAVAIGNRAVVSAAGGVALGAGSNASAAVGTTGTTINDTDYAFAGTAPVGTVSVGSVGNERTITNVAAGRLSATSTDAINGSQLFATNTAVDGLNDRTLKYDWTDTNGDGKVDPSEVHYDKATLAGVTSTDGGETGGTKITNLAKGEISDTSTEAINGSQLKGVVDSGMSFAGNTGTVTKALGETMSIQGTGTTGTFSGHNLQTKVDDVSGVMQLLMADDSTFHSVVATDGTHTSTLAENGLIITGGPSMTTGGIDAANNKITHVTAGSDDTDAVNVSQLKEQQIHYFSVNDDGRARANYDNLGATGVNSLAAGIGAHGAGEGSLALGMGSLAGGMNSIAHGVGSLASGESSVAIGTGAKAHNAGDVALGAGSETDFAVGTTGTTINDIDYTFAGTAPVGTVSVGTERNERTITNVAAGRLSATSTDAINGSQLFATNSAIDDVTDDVSGLNDRTLKYNWTDTNGDGKVDPSEVDYGNAKLEGVTSTDGGRTNGTKITNLARGDVSENSTDAINGSQLNETNNNVTNLGNTVDNIYNTGTKYFHANSTGTDSVASGIDAVAIGMGAVASHNGSVALGAGSVADGSTLGNTAYLVGGTATGEVNIGGRRITGLSAGAADTDAVNVAQLKAVDTNASEANERALKYDFVDNNGNGTFDAGDTVNYGSAHLGGPVSTDGGRTGGTKITNLARGDVSENSTDAINGSQLKATNDQVENNTTNIAGNTTDITNLGNTVDNIYNTGTKYFHANSTGTDSVASGIDAVAIGMGAVASHNGSVALGAGSVANGSTLGNTAYLVGGSATGEVNIGGRRITGLSAGAEDTDAVNVAQLKALDTDTSLANERALKYDFVDNNGNGTFDAGDTVNYGSAHLGGPVSTDGGRTGGTKITNLARGDVSENSTDAINGSQLKATNDQVDINTTNIAGNTTDITNLGNTVDNIYNTGTKYFHANSTGTDSVASGIDAVAIGMGAVASHNGSVALGAGSVADGSTLGNAAYLVGGTATGEVNIGGRRITGLSAGAEDTDAVNVAQLKAVGATASLANERALKYDFVDNNGNGTFDAGDTVNYGSAHLGGPVSTDGGRTGGTKIANLARGDVSENSTDAINGSQLFDVAGYTTNEYITNNGRGVRYVRTNDAGLTLADAHASGQASTAVGYNATSTGIGSIAMGQNALSDATNAIAIGKDAVASTANSVALGNGAKTADAVATTNMVIRGDTYAVAGTAPVGTVSVGDKDAERTLTNVAAGRVTAESTDAVNGSQLYATVSAINNISTDIHDLGEAAVKYDKNTDGTINYNRVTLAGGPTTITNVAAGTQDSDAVNYSQLKTVANQVTNISNGTDGMFQVNNTSNNPKPSVTGKDAAAGGAGAVASGDNSLAVGTKSQATARNSVALGANSVADRDNTISVGTVGGERQIANVAAGTKGTDAVNVSQLNAGINNAYNYTDNKFDSLKNMVDDNKHKMSAGIAGAMAMSSLPQPYSPGASMVSLGGGTFQDETAVALGASMISDNGKWVTKVAGTTNSQGDMGASVGVGYQW